MPKKETSIKYSPLESWANTEISDQNREIHYRTGVYLLALFGHIQRIRALNQVTDKVLTLEPKQLNAFNQLRQTIPTELIESSPANALYSENSNLLVEIETGQLNRKVGELYLPNRTVTLEKKISSGQNLIDISVGVEQYFSQFGSSLFTPFNRMLLSNSSSGNSPYDVLIITHLFKPLSLMYPAETATKLLAEVLPNFVLNTGQYLQQKEITQLESALTINTLTKLMEGIKVYQLNVNLHNEGNNSTSLTKIATFIQSMSSQQLNELVIQIENILANCSDSW
jgi:hypothetical protein